VQIGQTLFMNRHIFHSITKKHESLHPKPDALYRFKVVEADESRPLNACKKYMENVKEEAWQVGVTLATEAVKLLKKFKNDKTVDFELLRKSPEYYQFVLGTSKLQKVRLGKLTNDKKLLFWLNIYHTLIAHGYMLFGPPADTLGRKFIWTRNYKIEDYHVSADAIYNILRGRTNDLSSELKDVEGAKIQPLTMTVFCCFNGSDVSPPIRVFPALDTLIYDMKQTAKVFLENSVIIKEYNDEIWLPKVFKEPEFGEKKTVFEFLSSYLESKVTKNFIKTYVDTIELKYNERTHNDVKYV